MIVDLPIHVLAPADVAVAPDYMTRPDQDATNGMSRTVGLTGARFKITLIDIPVLDVSKARMMRSLFGRIKGKTNLVRFKIPDRYGIDGPFADNTQAIRDLYPIGVPFSTGAYFSTGVGFSVATLKQKIGTAAALNEPTLYLDGPGPVGLGGCYVSIEEFCYTVNGSWSEDNRIEISPGLRRAIAVDTEINYSPTFVGRMVTDSPGYEALRNGRFGSHTLEFIEDLTRARLPYAIE